MRSIDDPIVSDSSFSPYSSRDIKHYFFGQGARIRKRWGQNFIIDPNISSLIAEHIFREQRESFASSDLREGELPLLEVGPGFGSLSKELLKRGCKLYAVEIDPALFGFLQRQGEWEGKRAPYLLKEDILTFFQGLKEGKTFPFQRKKRDGKGAGIEELSLLGMEGDYICARDKKETGEGQKLRFICGNLPYSISTDFFRGLVSLPGIKGGVFLAQKEYARRILRREGEKSHSLGIFLHNHGLWKKCMDIGAKSFYPPPKIDSTLIAYRARTGALGCSPSILEKVLRLSFGSRRKKLKNNWKKKLTYYFPQISFAELLLWAEEAGIKADFRAEDLKASDFYFLSRKIEEKQRQAFPKN